MAQGDNPALPAGLRVFSGFVIVVLLLGSALFFAPDLVKPRWPWALTPFNARFLGSFYIAEMVVMIALLVWNRWSPARMILMMAFAFTLVVTVASAIHLDHFDFHRKNGWLWFIVYVGSALVSGWFLWRERGTLPVAAAVTGPRWRSVFLGETVVFALYGLGLFAAPSVFVAFWPWPVDVFHGQVYSAIFLAAAAGTWLLVRNAPREELVALGLAQLTIGALSIIGLVVTDQAVKRLDWAAPGIWAWIAVFAAIALTGLAKLRAAMVAGRA